MSITINNNGNSFGLTKIIVPNDETIKIIPSGLTNRFVQRISKWEEKNLSLEEIKNDTFKYNDLKNLNISNGLESIAFHTNGLCFRFKGIDGKKLIPDKKVEEEIKDFIDFTLIPDNPEYYFIPSISSTVLEKNELIRGSISIKDFDIRTHPWLGAKFKNQVSPGRMGVLADKFISIKRVYRGTIVVFLFHKPDGTFSRLGYILE
jgi:hypothetical protein